MNDNKKTPMQLFGEAFKEVFRVEDDLCKIVGGWKRPPVECKGRPVEWPAGTVMPVRDSRASCSKTRVKRLLETCLSLVDECDERVLANDAYAATQSAVSLKTTTDRLVSALARWVKDKAE